MYGTTRDEAEQLAALAREQRIGAASSLGSDRSISDYEVRAHSWHSDGSPRTWGVWPRWAYVDRPDLGAQFGGPFLDLAMLRRLGEQA